MNDEKTPPPIEDWQMKKPMGPPAGFQNFQKTDTDNFFEQLELEREERKLKRMGRLAWACAILGGSLLLWGMLHHHG